MLTELSRQLTALLSQAGYRTWAADAVPPKAEFPFVTVEIRPAASLHGLGRVTLTGWLPRPCRHADRLSLADALLRLVPPGGLKLPCGDGLALLLRGDRMNAEWPESEGALGVCVKHELRMLGGESDA
ncbi:MAG: hypothetical protein IJE07_12175 [Clostridia bacterium]|nr:hypothetical protein [Clostridia bacterium]